MLVSVISDLFWIVADPALLLVVESLEAVGPLDSSIREAVSVGREVCFFCALRFKLSSFVVVEIKRFKLSSFGAIRLLSLSSA